MLVVARASPRQGTWKTPQTYARPISHGKLTVVQDCQEGAALARPCLESFELDHEAATGLFQSDGAALPGKFLHRMKFIMYDLVWCIQDISVMGSKLAGRQATRARGVADTGTALESTVHGGAEWM